MSAVAGPETGPGKRRDSATTTFVLALASPLLIVAGWIWGFFLDDLGLLAAVASVYYGIRAFRHGGSTLLAAAGVRLALLTLVVVVYVFVTFAINPPE
jgi:hypothetical protein